MTAAKALRADARRNRERVLDAARAAFATDGLGVPLDEIARRAGVGAGTVYRHFPTKETLFEAVMLDRMRQLVDTAKSHRSADDPTEALLGFIRHLVLEAAPKRDLIDAMGEAGVSLHAALADSADQLRAQLKRLLTRAQKAGGIRTDVGIAELMALLSGAITGGQRHMPGGARLERVIAVICDGLRRRDVV